MLLQERVLWINEEGLVVKAAGLFLFSSTRGGVGYISQVSAWWLIAVYRSAEFAM